MTIRIAFANGHSNIACTDGIKGSVCQTDDEGSPIAWNWNSSSTRTTAGTSNSSVFVEGKLVAVEGDSMISHPNGAPCVSSPVNHAPSTSLCAANVFIGGKRAVRVGSKFNKGTSFDHTVTTGSSKVFIGGPSASV